MLKTSQTKIPMFVNSTLQDNRLLPNGAFLVQCSCLLHRTVQDIQMLQFPICNPPMFSHHFVHMHTPWDERAVKEEKIKSLHNILWVVGLGVVCLEAHPGSGLLLLSLLRLLMRKEMSRDRRGRWKVFHLSPARLGLIQTKLLHYPKCFSPFRTSILVYINHLLPCDTNHCQCWLQHTQQWTKKWPS